MIFESARISSRLLLEDLGMSKNGGEPPGPRTTAVPDPGRHPVAEAIEMLSRLIHPKPALIVNQRVPEVRPKP